MELILHQKQELNLFMTYKLRQAIELLQYSTYDLYQYLIEQEMENPLIELKEQKNLELYEGNGDRSSAPKSMSNSAIEFNQSKEVGMRDKLMQQAKILYKDLPDLKVIEYLIYNLDDNGYLPGKESEFFLYSMKKKLVRELDCFKLWGQQELGQEI